MPARTLITLTTALLAAGIACAQDAGTPRPDQLEFRAVYEELVETNTQPSNGSCTLAAERMAARLRAAGFKDSELTLFSVPEAPKDGGLVAVLAGSSKTAKPMLLLAHIDVVEAKRADWTRDPYTLIEENGWFYGRGASDDKSHAAIWTDMLVRFRKDRYTPGRTIKLALTCGEETSGVFNGAQWLAQNRRELIDAAFVLNEGGGGLTDGHGKLVVQELQVGEKLYQDYRVETTNPGGHSSLPIADNAIYQLADALAKIRAHEFPLKMTDTTRAYFAKTGQNVPGEFGRAMVALAKDPTDKAAEAIVNRDRHHHSVLRTTCVATMLDGGHAHNALPQRAGANVNCRIFPTETVEQTRAALERAIGDPGVKVTVLEPQSPGVVPPPLAPHIVGPAEKLVARYFPGVPLVPAMSTGATDAIHLAAVGLHVYGVPGPWGDPDGNGAHGLNERMEVRSLYIGRDFLTELVKAYAEQE